jgi:Xaa-Pro aminopeptidase
MKACKNENELYHMKQAHLRDAVALAEFMEWLENGIKIKLSISEVEIDEKLTFFRKDVSKNKFVDLSFPTIAGVGSNGAIIHYRYYLYVCNLHYYS